MNESVFRPGETCWRVERTDKAAFLVDSENYYRAVHDAVLAAKHQVFILGWDIDSRIRLIRGEGGNDITLGELLETAMQKNPDLHIYILSWDFAFIYMMEREPFPSVTWRFNTRDRLHFQLDNEIPFGASHHQKVVVADDAIAFSGGMDLSNNRWDTREHAPSDARRKNPAGEEYFSVHDIQLMVNAEAAAALGELARGRWLRATGQRVSPPPPVAHRWMESVPVAAENVDIAIARTEAPYKTYGELRENERLFVETIRRAKRFIYMENQYFSSAVITRELAARLESDDPPEVVIVTPSKNAGWLEEKTMENLRGRLLSRLLKADHADRLHLVGLEDDDGGFINVHAKLTIIDDAFIRVGSANLSNRSLGFDTECDLAFFHEEAAPGLLNDLLAEHMGTDTHHVETTRQETGSLIQTMKKLNPENGRRFTDVRVRFDQWAHLMDTDDPVLDPESPITIDRTLDDLSVSSTTHQEPEGEPMVKKKLRIARIIVALLFLGGLAAVWKFSPLAESLDRETVIQWAARIQGNPMAPLIVIAAFTLGSLVVFPVTLMVMGTAAIFPPVSGFIYAMIASLISSSVLYGIGRKLKHAHVNELSEGRLSQIHRAVAKRGMVAVAILRMVPVAPFSIINLVSGTTAIRFRDYFFGTALGMTPGILAFTIFTDTLKRVIMNPDIKHVLIFVAVVVVIGGGLGWVSRRLKSRAPVDDRGLDSDA